MVEVEARLPGTLTAVRFRRLLSFVPRLVEVRVKVKMRVRRRPAVLVSLSEL